MQIYNLEFSDQEIKEAVTNNRLLSIEIEFSKACNFNCSYCYTETKTARSDEMSRREIKDTILQAREMGAKKIIILGGEPTVYPHLEEMLNFIHEQNLQVEIFSNGTGIDRPLAQLFAKIKARVILKMNSRDEELQDKLAGKKGAFKIIRKALQNLRAAGYPATDKFLGISTVICQPNIKELPDMWRWLRQNSMEPYFEVITPQANALENIWLNVDGTALKELFEELSQIDRDEFNLEWEPQPPLVGNKCMRHQVSCLITASGDVMPCVGVTINIGNIRKEKLKDIILNSEVINNLKNFQETITGACSTCEKADECYGCRGAAYQLTGDYLASDPTCWRNKKKN